MAVALVGTIGAVSGPTLNTAITPAWGASENRTAGNLLVLWVACQGSATIPTLTTNGADWVAQKSVAGTTCSSVIFTKVAYGSDPAPTVAAIASGYVSAQLAEFSGVSGSTAYRNASATATTTSPMVATTAGVDYLSGSLVLAAASDYYSSAATKTLTHTVTGGATVVVETSNEGTSTRWHYDFIYGPTTTKVSATSDSYAFTTTNGTGQALVLITLTPGVTDLNSLTANAVIKHPDTASTFTAGAVIKHPNTAFTFTASAWLQKTVPATFTANATVKATKTGSFSANAVVKAAVSSSTTANAVIKRQGTGTFSANAVIKATMTFGSGAAWVEGQWIDPNLVGEPLAVNAVIKGSQPGSLAADAIRLRTFKFGKAGQ
jgi:hypothetical protein